MAMERSDSLTVMKSLTADYGEDSDEEIPSAVDNISDEETQELLAKQEPRPSSLPNLQNDNSNSSVPEKPPTKLVSYGPDDQEDEESQSEEEVEEESDLLDIQKTDIEEKVLDTQDASALSRKVRNMSAEEIQIPPEPVGRCSKELQEKIARNYDRMLKSGYSNNVMIQQRKDFRNPSIYEKLIEFLHIEGTKEQTFLLISLILKCGLKNHFMTNYKTRRRRWKRRRRRKDRTKIDFIVGSKKVSSSSDGSAPDEKKRKTKWDSQPQVSSAVRSSNMPNPSVVTLTTSATGTKTTVISAIGSITKKSSQK
ncbi:LOW QUALITY PROTEIN: SAP30-binding protein-like [Haliotis rubra]|uniref:LOW QUALITY PROTEIN: SAP30-binding protein-like n=1 Tax=Haliotis rubra TaxID=36100 RepID=UPI001EE5E2B6|nr:LOW QUALITY PROTEIN: SAP30-binding protein-like [Haliotis rubra]